MSDNESRKRAARAFQATNPGTSYTRALREVSGQRRPLHAVLGAGLDGAALSVSLEWEAQGGSGPHCLIAGSEVGSLLGVLASGLAETQRPHDLELLFCGDEATPLPVAARRVAASELVGHVDELLVSRQAILRSAHARDVLQARNHGHPVPTTVLLIEDNAGAWGRSEPLSRWVRMGRSLGLNVVLGASAAEPPTPADEATPADRPDRFMLTDPVLAQMTATILGLGDHRARLRTLARRYRDGRAESVEVLTDFTFTPQPADERS